MVSEKILTRTSELWIREDGITQVVDLPNFIKTVEDAKETMAATAQLTSATCIDRAMIELARRGSLLRNSATYFVAVIPRPNPASVPTVPRVL